MDFNDDDLVTLEVACQIIGGQNSPISKATIYRMMQRGILRKPIHPAPGISRLRRSWCNAVVDQAEAASTEAA